MHVYHMLYFVFLCHWEQIILMFDGVSLTKCCEALKTALVSYLGY